MPIDAPYNFVPLANTVVTPYWADLVSHDLPFQDGLSGTIDFTLTALSPLLVGGEQQRPSEQRPGTITPFKTPDGRYAIPGSSLRGMIRSVLEIATFSQMSKVDDKSYGLRDISGAYVADAYAERVRNRVKTGFLRLNAHGEPEIVPCSMLRLSHRDLEDWWNEQTLAPIFRAGLTVERKYAHWKDKCRQHGLSNPLSVPFTGGDKVTALGRGDLIGYPVFTGQISAEKKDDRRFNTQYKGRPKYRDFMFYEPRVNETFNVRSTDSAAWRDFLFIHGDEDGKFDMPWPGFWKSKFRNNEQIPVFYIREAKRLQIGLAFMPKLAGDFSIHDMIKHTSPDHLDATKSDLATLIFGKIDDRPNGSLKGRVWCELSPAVGQPELQHQGTAILGSPHPTYFPNYIRQDTNPKTGQLNGSKPQYATYLFTTTHKKPELSGWKRYPARPNHEVKMQIPEGAEQQRNNKIQTYLHTLASGTTFACRAQFHNLKPEELGAVLWALDFGGNSTYRHGLGLAKSFGFGQMSVQLNESKSQIIPNDMMGKGYNFAACVQAFRSFMDNALGAKWENTPQIRALLAMANPDQRVAFPGKLKHMALAMQGANEFNNAKKSGLGLVSYVAIPKTVAVVANTAARKPPVVAPVVATVAKGPETWPGVKLRFTPGNGIISTQGEQRAASVREDKDKFLAGLSNAAIKRLQQGNVIATVTVEPRGNDWKIIGITW